MMRYIYYNHYNFIYNVIVIDSFGKKYSKIYFCYTTVSFQGLFTYKYYSQVLRKCI